MARNGSNRRQQRTFTLRFQSTTNYCNWLTAVYCRDMVVHAHVDQSMALMRPYFTVNGFGQVRARPKPADAVRME